MTAHHQRAAQGGCPFCAIAAGRAPAPIVHQSDRLVAFLDSAPIRPGHLRIIPRGHFPHFNALPPDLARALLDLGQRLAEAQRAVFKVDRVGFPFRAGEAPPARGQGAPLLAAGDVPAPRPKALGQGTTTGGPSGEALAAAAFRLSRSLVAAEDNAGRLAAGGMGAMPWRPLPDSGVLVG
ncbi:HIT family protein [Pelagibius marinus]|uniref:HIT family protein n=1 Tax=Pelagibius marinus TaxID=2762760 RepID=UPI0018722185|nr:HIT family protein [Pelagibius marinus]